MKYTIRAIKYFFYFIILTSLIVTALVLTGLAEGDIDELFVEGYDSLWKIAIFFAVVAAVYPKLGFITRSLYINEDNLMVRQNIKSYLLDRRYELESETDTSMTFRAIGFGGRVLKMYEDRLTLTFTPSGWEMEGLRKDVMRLAAGLENYKHS